MTVKEAALRLGLSPPTLYRLVARKAIGHYRVGPAGKRIVLREEDLSAYLEGCRVSPRARLAGGQSGKGKRYLHLEI